MKPKKLNLEEMWKLYLLLEPVIKDREREEFILDDMVKLFELSEKDILLAVLLLLDDNISIGKSEDLYSLQLFMEGLNENSFYDFVDFIEATQCPK